MCLECEALFRFVEHIKETPLNIPKNMKIDSIWLSSKFFKKDCFFKLRFIKVTFNILARSFYVIYIYRQARKEWTLTFDRLIGVSVEQETYFLHHKML